MRPRSEVSREEATRDPVFLFQSGEVVVHSEPEGYYHDGEGFRPGGTDDAGLCGPLSDDDDWEYLTDRQLLDMGSETAIRIWHTEMVFADRSEAEAYGRGRAYNYPGGWRAYCVPCEGSLKDALTAAAPQ